MLQNIPLFSVLGTDELEAIERLAVTRNFPKNSVIINEGDHTDSLYVILPGKVKIFLTDDQQNGRQGLGRERAGKMGAEKRVRRGAESPRLEAIYRARHRLVPGKRAHPRFAPARLCSS